MGKENTAVDNSSEEEFEPTVDFSDMLEVETEEQDFLDSLEDSDSPEGSEAGEEEVETGEEKDDSTTTETPPEEAAAEEGTPDESTPVEEATIPETPEEDSGTEEELEPPQVVQPQQPTQEQVQEFRKKAHAELVKHYQLPADAADGIITNPEETLPALLAKVHLSVVDQVMGSLNQVVPQVVQTHQQTQSVQQKAEKAFFQRWPQLKDHYQDVQRTAMMYRQLNPQADVGKLIEDVGLHMMVTKGIQPQEEKAAEEAVETQQPFTPANPGGGKVPTPQASKPKGGAFSDLISEFEEEI